MRRRSSARWPSARDRRGAAPAVAALLGIALGLPAVVRAAASFDPADPTPPIPDDAGSVPVELLLASVVLVGSVVAFGFAWRSRPAWRPLLGAMLTAAPLVVVGLAVMAVGIWFADWSGQHRVSWPAVGVGVSIVFAGIVLGLRRRRERLP